MHKLPLILFSLIAPTLAGTTTVLALVNGISTLGPLLIAAAIGALIAIPISIAIARALKNM